MVDSFADLQTKRVTILSAALAVLRDRKCHYLRPLGECFLSQRPEAVWCAACVAKKALVQAEGVK